MPVNAAGVSVGIVNHNGESYLSRTLESVERLGAEVDDVLLVDSGSTDRGVALARERFPRVRVFELGANLGPGAARNRAIREARHDRVLLIDNDVEPEPGCAATLAAALEAHPGAVLAMAAVLYERAPDTVQYVGAVPHVLGAPALLYADTPARQLDGAVRAVGSAITCCVMIDRARYGERPWFDERLFFYFEDHEFGLRATLQGFDCLIVPSARCLHRAGTIGVSLRQTGTFTSVRVRHTIRNRWLSMLMLYQSGTLLRFAPALMTFEGFQLAGAVRKGWLGHWVWAIGSATRMLPHVLRTRRMMRRSRRRRDLDVLRPGPFPFNKALHASRLERAAQRVLDGIVSLNWRLAGRRA
jgi:GT2 family glycosyltransferase